MKSPDLYRYPTALARANRKLQRAAVSAKVDHGFAEALPYEDASFDRVLSSFMFHHLESDQKEQALREVRRAPKSGQLFRHLLHSQLSSKPRSPPPRAGFIRAIIWQRTLKVEF